MYEITLSIENYQSPVISTECILTKITATCGEETIEQEYGLDCDYDDIEDFVAALQQDGILDTVIGELLIKVGVQS